MLTTETFTLDTVVDEDILLFLSKQQDRNCVIREALRRYMRDEGLTLRDLLNAIEALSEPQSNDAADQPEEAVANLMEMLALAES